MPGTTERMSLPYPLENETADPAGDIKKLAEAIDADVETQVGAQARVDDHADLTSTAHGATSEATANTLIARDANGRAKVAAPSASDDIARKDTVDAHANITNPHLATSAATANRLILRDASGRAKVAAPSASDDIATKGYVDKSWVALSDDVILESLAEASGSSSNTTEMIKAFYVTRPGRYRLTFEGRSSNSNNITYRVKFSPVEKSLDHAGTFSDAVITSGTNYVALSMDMTINAPCGGWIILSQSHISSTVGYVKNARLRGAESVRPSDYAD